MTEADEASVSSGPVPTPANRTPRFSYTRIIALLVRGSRNLIIEKLPVKNAEIQAERLPKDNEWRYHHFHRQEMGASKSTPTVQT